MMEILNNFERKCPQWLQTLPPDLNVRLLRRVLARATKNAIVYPGAGVDWSPIRQTIGATHSYLFFDYIHQFEASSLEKALNPPSRWGGERERVECVGMLQFEIAQLYAPGFEEHVEEALFRKSGEYFGDHYGNRQCWYADPSRLGRGTWAVFSTPRHGRISVLYLHQEAILGIALLHLATGNSPRGLVLQEHGLGGNCWPSFGAAYHMLIKENGLTPPKVLITNNDHYGLSSQFPYTNLGADVAAESCWQNQRDVFALTA